MRTTLVPPKKNDEGADDAEGDIRNVLHVLLSCTSFGTSCFTLREWGVIAIRNVLENNTQNQQVVALLEAQKPVQSAALDSAGVQVSLDQQGKVSLSTLEENDNEDS
jgi:ataxin-10